MNSVPTVSVIVPNFNHAPFLDQRIESILNQSFKNFELIILDDSSTDNSKEIIEKYRNHPKASHVEYNAQNSGSPFKQWKKGIDLARGKYIWIAESDDWAESRFLEKLISFFQDDQSIGLAYCQSIIADENSTQIRTNYEWTEDLDAQFWRREFIVEGSSLLSFFLKKNIIPNVSAVLFKKEVFEKAGGVDTKYHLAGDWDLWVRIAKVSSIAYSPECLNFFRSTQASTRVHSNFKKKELRLIEGLRVLRQFKPISEDQRLNLSSEKSALYQRWIDLYISNPKAKNLLLNLSGAKLRFIAFFLVKKIIPSVIRKNSTFIS